MRKMERLAVAFEPATQPLLGNMDERAAMARKKRLSVVNRRSFQLAYGVNLVLASIQIIWHNSTMPKKRNPKKFPATRKFVARSDASVGSATRTIERVFGLPA